MMSNIDRQRITAVQILEGLGYTFASGEWKAPAGAVASLVPEADAMHGQLVRRAHELGGFRLRSRSSWRSSTWSRPTKQSVGLKERYLAARARRAPD